MLLMWIISFVVSVMVLVFIWFLFYSYSVSVDVLMISRLFMVVMVKFMLLIMWLDRCVLFVCLVMVLCV